MNECFYYNICMQCASLFHKIIQYNAPPPPQGVRGGPRHPGLRLPAPRHGQARGQPGEARPGQRGGAHGGHEARAVGPAAPLEGGPRLQGPGGRRRRRLPERVPAIQQGVGRQVRGGRAFQRRVARVARCL